MRPRFAFMKLSKSDQARVREATAAFNVRRAQFVRSFGDDDYTELLPEKQNAKDIIGRVDTKSELNAILRDLRTFAKKRSLDFVEVGDIVKTDWEMNIAKREIEKVNIERKKQRKARGLEDTFNPRTGTTKDLALTEKKIPQFRTEKGFADWFKRIYKQSKPDYYTAVDKRYVDSFFKSMKLNMPRHADKLIGIISKIPISVIVDLRTEGVINLAHTYGAEEEDSKAMQMITELQDRGYYDASEDEDYQDYLDNGVDDELDLDW